MALSTFSWTHEQKASTMQAYLESITVAKAISDFKSGVKYIHNPFPTPGSITTNSPMAGTYTAGAFVSTDDDLVVNREAIYSTHIFDFEATFADYDLAMETFKLAAAKLAEDMDTELFTILDAGAANTVTVAGGFAAGTVISSLAEALGHISGFAQMTNGTYVVIDNTQVAAFVEAGAGNGFSYADAVLRNGMMGQLLGFDIYVVRSGQLPANVALAGIKKASTTGIGGSIKVEEKGVAGKTGKEMTAINYSRSALWNNNQELVVKFNLL